MLWFCFESKNNFFADFFGENIFKIITSDPDWANYCFNDHNDDANLIMTPQRYINRINSEHLAPGRGFEPAIFCCQGVDADHYITPPCLEPCALISL
jgi:hypothetical protein